MVTVCTGDGGFPRRINIGQHDAVDILKDLHKIIEAVARTSVAVRLESNDNAAAGPRTAYCREGCRHFVRMMTIVINQCEGSRDAAIRILNRNITPLCKAPAYALKFCQAALDVFVLNARQGRDCDRRQGIAHIMYARQVQYDGQRRMIRA